MLMLKNKIQGCYTAAFIFFKLPKKKNPNLKKVWYMNQSTTQVAYQVIWKRILYNWCVGIIRITVSQTNLTWSYSKPCPETYIHFPINIS